MKIVKCGKWTIAVDVEKTKEYYRNYVIDDDQTHRNFAQYCKTMSDEERDFFESFGITPECCKVTGIGVSRKREAPCGGYYLFCGSYLECPPEEWVSVEEFAANNFESNVEDPRIQIGMFQFNFNHACPEDYVGDGCFPEGFLCVDFWCDELRWLLKEKPEEIMYEVAKPWEIGKRIARYFRSKRQARQYFEECRQTFRRKFAELGIEFSEINARGYKNYKQKWVDTYAPTEADKRKIERLCVQNAEYTTYLWHIFSYEFLDSETEDAARLYDRADKKECTLINNGNLLGFRLKNADSLTADVLESFDDVTVTAADFSWTYSKTHECYLGPYYYNYQTKETK